MVKYVNKKREENIIHIMKVQFYRIIGGIEMNIIERKHFGNYEIKFKNETAKKLKGYKPKGCPFKDYTLFDLVCDWFKAYSWKLLERILSIESFIKMLQAENDIKAVTYGDDIINIINE